MRQAFTDPDAVVAMIIAKIWECIVDVEGPCALPEHPDCAASPEMARDCKRWTLDTLAARRRAKEPGQLPLT